MPQPSNPSQVVRSSSMLWSDQVSIVEAQEALDYAGSGSNGLALLAETVQPVVYEFYGGRRIFRDKVDPYV
jgi:hypothetical protein